MELNQLNQDLGVKRQPFTISMEERNNQQLTNGMDTNKFQKVQINSSNGSSKKQSDSSNDSSEDLIQDSNKKYSLISRQKRKEVIRLVIVDKLTYKETSKRTGVKQSTAKAITKVFIQQGRIGKRIYTNTPKFLVRYQQEKEKRDKEKLKIMGLKKNQISENIKNFLDSVKYNSKQKRGGGPAEGISFMQRQMLKKKILEEQNQQINGMNLTKVPTLNSSLLSLPPPLVKSMTNQSTTNGLHTNGLSTNGHGLTNGLSTNGHGLTNNGHGLTTNGHNMSTNGFNNLNLFGQQQQFRKSQSLSLIHQNYAIYLQLTQNVSNLKNLFSLQQNLINLYPISQQQKNVQDILYKAQLQQLSTFQANINQSAKQNGQEQFATHNNQLYDNSLRQPNLQLSQQISLKQQTQDMVSQIPLNQRIKQSILLDQNFQTQKIAPQTIREQIKIENISLIK